MSNPIFARTEKEARQQQYAGFGNSPMGQQMGQTSAMQGGADYYAQQQTYPGYDQRTAPQGYPMGGERSLTMDDVIMKTFILFALVLAGAGASWFLINDRPDLASPLWMGGMFLGLGIGLVIGFMKKVSVPLIMAYSLVEGVFVGAMSRTLEAWYPGIVMTAVIATLATFGGMLLGYKTGLIKVSSKTRRMFGMVVLGYLAFSLLNIVLQFTGVLEGWGFFSGPYGWLIALFGVGLAAFSLAMDFDAIDHAVAARMPEQYSWLLAHGLIVSLVWLYVEILRLLAILRGND